MLDFSDQPYRFFPPRYFGPTAWVMRQYNRHRFLPVVKQIAEVQVQGAEHLAAVFSRRVGRWRSQGSTLH